MSTKSSSKKGGGKGGKKRVVIQLPPGSPLDAMSEAELNKHVEDLVGKAGVGKKHVGGQVEELLIEASDSAAPGTLGPQEPGWGARWSRRCAL